MCSPIFKHCTHRLILTQAKCMVRESGEANAGQFSKQHVGSTMNDVKRTVSWDWVRLWELRKLRGERWQSQVITLVRPVPAPSCWRPSNGDKVVCPRRMSQAPPKPATLDKLLLLKALPFDNSGVPTSLFWPQRAKHHLLATSTES